MLAVMLNSSNNVSVYVSGYQVVNALVSYVNNSVTKFNMLAPNVSTLVMLTTFQHLLDVRT